MSVVLGHNRVHCSMVSLKVIHLIGELIKLFHFRAYVLKLNWARNTKTAMRLKVFVSYIIIMQIRSIMLIT